MTCKVPINADVVMPLVAAGQLGPREEKLVKEAPVCGRWHVGPPGSSQCNAVTVSV